MINLFRKSVKVLSHLSSFKCSGVQMAKLVRKDDKVLVEQWWSMRAFREDQSLEVPVVCLAEGKYEGSTVTLDHNIFNLPLRRDIIHNVYIWRTKLFKRTTHVTRTKGTTAGSGAKPFKQKGTGRARQGNKRAPGRKGGGKAHGAVPRDHSYSIPKKLRLLGLKTMLSAKLAEGNILVLDTFHQPTPKTQHLKQKLQALGLQGKREKNLFVTEYKKDENFEMGSGRLRGVETVGVDRVNIVKLLEHRRIVFTVESLRQLQQDLQDRTHMRFTRQPRGYKTTVYSSQQERASLLPPAPQTPSQHYDPSKPLDLKFQVLKDYLSKYQQLHHNGQLNQYYKQPPKPTN